MSRATRNEMRALRLIIAALREPADEVTKYGIFSEIGDDWQDAHEVMWHLTIYAAQGMLIDTPAPDRGQPQGVVKQLEDRLQHLADKEDES